MEVEVNEPISVASSLGTSDGGLGEENPHNFDPDSHLAGSGVRPSYYGGYIPHSTLLPRHKLSHDATIPTIIEQQQQIIEQPHLSVEVPSTYLQPVNIPSPTDNNTSSSPPSFMKRISSLNSISNLQPVNIPSPPKNNTASPKSFMKRVSSVNSISHFLDQSGHLLKGKGILASKRDVDVAPEGTYVRTLSFVVIVMHLRCVFVFVLIVITPIPTIFLFPSNYHTPVPLLHLKNNYPILLFTI